MRKAGRVIILSILGLFSTAVLSAMAALVAAVSLAATALIVPGTGTPDANEVENYLENFRDYYMQTPCEEGGGCADEDLEGINYYASFWPIPLPGWCDPGRCEKFDDSVDDGVDNLGDALTALQDLGYTGDIVIAGYSQGARVATISKMQFASGQWDALLEQLESEGGEVKFVYIGNPNRPNGGLLSRLGFLGTIPIIDVTTGQPTPTDTDFETEDWAIRWEGIADFPQYLFNPLAVVNSLLGFYYDHGTYLAINGGSDPGETPAGYTVEEWEAITSNPELYPDIVDIQVYGDTTYYTITPKYLPIVRPLHAIPIVGKPIADLIEPALRVIIEETGYNRDIPFGQPTELQLIPIFNPITLGLKLVPAIFLGINNFLANFGLATEIPLSPTTPITPVSPLTDQQDEQTEDLEQATLLNAPNENEDSSEARLTVVQDNNSDVEQQPTGADETTTAGEIATANPVEAAKAKWEAAKAELEAKREAAKAEREAKWEAAKAEREAKWEAAKAARESAMQDLKDRLETAKAALSGKGDDDAPDGEADPGDAGDAAA
ncbi:PE-PPE domain-containing protein [Mycolicibacterium gadium]|uniref:PE-PPE domain-containing protein n=1 Tax=Mycolicibacterium gadium TaxID=1794 RepID=A0ABT6GJ20_MYCGU|nr:PE-PPE domain-containing protein [Mycolicibacterium gadium]MDG5481373.1 PE-PPE domain-containing protein [Mycolicibacterium gadium]